MALRKRNSAMCLTEGSGQMRLLSTVTKGNNQNLTFMSLKQSFKVLA